MSQASAPQKIDHTKDELRFSRHLPSWIVASIERLDPKKPQTKPDTYPDYFVTAVRPVNKDNTHPRDLQRLEKLSVQGWFRVTAVTVTKDGDIKQRRFSVRQEDLKTMGFSGSAVEQMSGADKALGDGTAPILDQIFFFETLGNYLIPYAEVFPRVESLARYTADPQEVAKISQLLKTAQETPSRKKIKTRFEWRSQRRQQRNSLE